MEGINLIANHDSKSPAVEAYRMIRTNIQFSKVGKELKTILLTSTTPNEGKSTTISNLAVVMAQAGNRVLLMDCDMRNPTQHKIFGVSNVGLTNIVSTGADLHGTIQNTPVENLYLLTSGPVSPNPSELFGGDFMHNLLNELKNEFDYILIDTPPVMPVTDATVLASYADGVILLIGSGSVSPSMAREAKERLALAGSHILGVILNKVDVESHGYGYYYYYGHDHKE